MKGKETIPPPLRPRRPTLRQQRFVQALPTAKSATDAARIAGYSDASGAASVRATELVRNSSIAPAIQAQAQATERATIASVVERKELLTQIQRAELPGVEMDHRLRAVDTHNRMDGMYIERRINLDLDASKMLLTKLTEMMQGQLGSGSPGDQPSLSATEQVQQVLGDPDEAPP